MLVVDKPRGPTSHDVVGRLRRTLRTRRVGHAGTLDPMATGVLVVLVGEATKLSAFLTAHGKRYLASVELGRSTTTFDAEGETVAEAPIPEPVLEELCALSEKDLAGGPGEKSAPLEHRAPRLWAALEAERARTEQVPPAYSAVHVGGKRSYTLARAGESPELAPRAMSVRSLTLRGVELAELDVSGARVARVHLELDVAKGYYVRSLARDLGERLGVPAHLVALRRTASGPFQLGRAVPLDASAEAARAAIHSLAEAAAAALPLGRLTEAGAVLASQGRRLGAEHFVEPPPSDAPAAWLDPDGRLVALGAPAAEDPGIFQVLRGFVLSPRGAAP